MTYYPQPDTVPTEETTVARDTAPEKIRQRDFYDYSELEILGRLDQGKNADILPDYAAPQGNRDYTVFIAPQDADPLEALQAEHPDAQLTLLEETDEYALYSAEGSQIPVLLLKQFRMVGNGYACYDGGLTEEDVLRNFDLLAHDQAMLWRGFRDDPEVKCVSYDFYAVTENDGAVTFGYYCFNIDRDDHLVNVERPDWNMMRQVGETSLPAEIGAADPMPEDTIESDEEIEAWAQNMEDVDSALSKLTDTNDFRQADVDTRRFMVVNLLNDLGDAGMIVKESIHESEDLVTFEYAGGGSGGVKLTPFDPLCN